MLFLTSVGLIAFLGVHIHIQTGKVLPKGAPRPSARVRADFRDTFLERYAKLFDDRDLSLVDEIFAPDFVSHMAHAGDLDRSGLKAYIASFYRGAPDSKQEVNQVCVTHNRLILHVTYSGTHTGKLFDIAPTGKALKMDGISIFSFNRKGQVIESWAMLDIAGLYKQIGAYPPMK